MFFFFKKAKQIMGLPSYKNVPFTSACFSQLMVILVEAALFFPSDLYAHTSECFHFRREEDTGANRLTSKAATQKSVTVLRC